MQTGGVRWSETCLVSVLRDLGQVSMGGLQELTAYSCHMRLHLIAVHQEEPKTDSGSRDFIIPNGSKECHDVACRDLCIPPDCY